MPNRKHKQSIGPRSGIKSLFLIDIWVQHFHDAEPMNLVRQESIERSDSLTLILFFHWKMEVVGR